MLTTLLAQATSGNLGVVGTGLGVGLSIVGAGIGIGKIGGSALDGIARQPEAAGTISTQMIIAAALVEGAALFGLVIMGFIVKP